MANIPKTMQPEQLLANCYDSYEKNPNFINLMAGGFIESNSTFSYEISNLSCYLFVYTVSGSGIITTS